MDDKEILYRVIKGFELVPANRGFGHPYVTKTGAATLDLSKRINTWIKQNFPQSNIMTSYEGVYKTINFRRVMTEHLIFKQFIRETIEEARSQSTTRKVRDAIVASDPSHIKPAQKTNRIYAPDLSTEDLIKKIKGLYNTEVKVIEPSKPGSDSSKFPTLEFKVDGTDIRIVHAKGIVAGAEGEIKQETTIQGKIRAVGKPVKIEAITTPGQTVSYKDIIDFKRVGGNKKADFVFERKDGTRVYVQYKSPTHQQMSGITKFDPSKYKELGSFIEEVKAAVSKSPNKRLDSPMFREISDDEIGTELKKLAVYGVQNNTPEGVQLYCIGDLDLKSVSEDVMKLTASKIYAYPEIPIDLDRPVLGATFRADRNQYGVPNVRFGIYPASYFKG
jgi:hypothetical protein